ncbi:MAG: SGNH hydrolase domain-containing protein [Planctomycetota bacterium]
MAVVLIMLLGAAAIAAELIAHYVLELGDPVLMQTHPTIEYLAQPNQDARVYGTRHLINHVGMRSDQLPADPATWRLLVLGDSVINGGRLTDHDALATTLAQTALGDALDQPVWVGNASAGSWGPGNWLAYVEEFGTFRADAALIVLSPHDIADVPTFDPANAEQLTTETPWTAAGVALGEVWARVAPQVLRSERQTENPNDLSQPGIAIPRANHPARRASERSLTALLKRFADERIPAAVLYFPEADSDARHAEPRQRLRNISQQASASFIDLSDTFLTDAPFTNPAYRDRMHPSAFGQRLLAEALTEAALRLLDSNRPRDQSMGVPAATEP